MFILFLQPIMKIERFSLKIIVKFNKKKLLTTLIWARFFHSLKLIIKNDNFHLYLHFFTAASFGHKTNVQGYSTLQPHKILRLEIKS